jgi:hypothetical protein
MFLHSLKYRIVTVTIVTNYDSVLWRLKAVTMRLVLESFKYLVLTSSFWDFLWRPTLILLNPSYCDGTILWLTKSGHNEDGYRKLQKSFFSWLFVTISDFVYFYTSLAYSTDLRNISCCRTNIYQNPSTALWRSQL